MRKTNLQGLRSGVSKHSQRLTKALAEQTEDVHNEIDTIVKDIQSEIDDIDSQHLSVINKHEKELNKCINEITQAIINSNDVCLLTVYTFRIEEFSCSFQLN